MENHLAVTGWQKFFFPMQIRLIFGCRCNRYRTESIVSRSKTGLRNEVKPFLLAPFLGCPKSLHACS